MSQLTVPSSIIAPSSEAALSPGMVAALWEIANELDLRRISGNTVDAVWLEIETSRLRGPAGRDDNGNLRKWLKRLSRIEIEGEYRGNAWGAVIVAEWHINQRGALARILVPPAAVKALRSAETFAKIETAAAHQLPGHARRLYALLADKKRLGKPEWTFELGELRALMGVADKKTYLRWASFRDWVITPAIAGINDYGTVAVTMEPVKRGRAVHAVKFSWAWKSLDEAHVTLEENERPHIARRKEPPENPDAPPLMDAGESDPVAREGVARLVGNLADKLRSPDALPLDDATDI